MEKKIEFIRCPRCELNYINKDDKFCSVCKKEMEAAYNRDDDLDMDLSLDLDICPVCKTNYISEDEVMCASCQKERNLDKSLHGDDDDIDTGEWQDEDDESMLEPEDELGEMVNTIDVDDTDDSLGGLEDLDLGIPLDEDMDFGDMEGFDDDEHDDGEDDYDYDDEDDFDDDFDDDFKDLDDDDDEDDDEDDEDDYDDDYDDDEDDDYDDKPKKKNKKKDKD